MPHFVDTLPTFQSICDIDLCTSLLIPELLSHRSSILLKVPNLDKDAITLLQHISIAKLLG